MLSRHRVCAVCGQVSLLNSIPTRICTNLSFFLAPLQMQQLPELPRKDHERSQNLSATGTAHQPDRCEQQLRHRWSHATSAARAGAEWRSTAPRQLSLHIGIVDGIAKRSRSGSGSGSHSRSGSGSSRATWRSAKGNFGCLELVVLAAVPADGMGVRADCLIINLIAIGIGIGMIIIMIS